MQLTGSVVWQRQALLLLVGGPSSQICLGCYFCPGSNFTDTSSDRRLERQREGGKERFASEAQKTCLLFSQKGRREKKKKKNIYENRYILINIKGKVCAGKNKAKVRESAVCRILRMTPNKGWTSGLANSLRLLGSGCWEATGASSLSG